MKSLGTESPKVYSRQPSNMQSKPQLTLVSPRIATTARIIAPKNRIKSAKTAISRKSTNVAATVSNIFTPRSTQRHASDLTSVQMCKAIYMPASSTSPGETRATRPKTAKLKISLKNPIYTMKN